MGKKERPILMNEFSIKAILSGRKTQTRRIIKPQPNSIRFSLIDVKDGLWRGHPPAGPPVWEAHCPYGEPGDYLWVRESWSLIRYYIHSLRQDYIFDVEYGDRKNTSYENEGEVFGRKIRLSEKRVSELSVITTTGKKPSIFMPREFSRIQLEILDIRVEKLQEISGNDAISEGCTREVLPGWKQIAPHEKFANLWTSIHGDGEFGWDENPWVWVIEFRRIQ